MVKDNVTSRLVVNRVSESLKDPHSLFPGEVRDNPHLNGNFPQKYFFGLDNI